MKTSKTETELKQIVKDMYASIAVGERQGCCGDQASEMDYACFSDSYEGKAGYLKDADLGLGCGLPTEYALIQPGDTVVDLGSGAGNDCFVARSQVGAEGRVIGVDFTLEMVQKARENARKMDYDNIDFILGEIDHNPLADDLADVVVSNCVFNLIPNRQLAFEETFRIIKPGGHFSISDIVIVGEIPKSLRDDAALYAGCVAGAMDKGAYLSMIEETGFVDITLQKEKKVAIPEHVLTAHLSETQMQTWRDHEIGIYSLSVFARKAAGSDENCCNNTCCR